MSRVPRILRAILIQFIAAVPGVVSGVCVEDEAVEQARAAKAVPETVVLEDTACPFELTDADKERVDQILESWEPRSRSIRSLRCKFTRRQYIRALGETPDVAEGEITYSWPNRASYHVLGSAPERWERDEKTIRRFDYDKKVVFECPLTAAENGNDSWPIPLLYQVRAADLKRDYWIRVNSDDRPKGEILLELHPRQRPVQRLGNVIRWANDAMSTGYLCRYQPLYVLLREDDFEPFALCFNSCNGDRTTFVLTDVVAGTESPARTLSEILCDFARPIPTGWTKLER
jgi:hypothetical protein